ncbi:hypothetical protein CCACVL1_07248 [Corchorus capsularis]|uniref:Uncharacterized protein n=1 Tax=Corchorus capsularis TaxID=210143 RepID=A0A1R3J844_COCAP|nr:hypothetical protein CCACVL1_07248 [Corchorus capsularis]
MAPLRGEAIKSSCSISLNC